MQKGVSDECGIIDLDEEYFYATTVIHEPHTDGNITFAGLNLKHITCMHLVG